MISIRDLSLSFGSLQILDHLNLEIKEGEFLVLLGASGCGKSTLLNCIAGLLDISGGQIIIDNKNVTWEEPKDRGIGMVFQSYALYPQMTVRGNLSFGLKNAGASPDVIKERVGKAAKILQIEPLLKRKPAALSGGQRQRVAIGRALVRDASVFLFDEPLSNLDAKLRAELRVEIKRLHKSLHNTMVYVTHDQVEAMTLADRIAVMRDGIIQQLGDPHTIYHRPQNLYVADFIGSMNFITGAVRDGKAFAFDDHTINLKNYQAENTLTQDQKTVLGIRPEHVILNRQGSSLTLIGEGRVELDEPMGPDSLVWLKVGQTTFCARVAGAATFTPGDQVQVCADMTHASLFDAANEQRL
ncbi:MAG: ABC transporter ATP-binding protein [Pseudomonadota bacterium]